MLFEKTNSIETFLHLLALASRLEGEGQYNLAKLARAAADSMSRHAANPIHIPTNIAELAADIEKTAAALSDLGMDASLVGALERGAAAMVEGRLPLIHETPHAYVCRTCGHLALGEPAEKCPNCGAWPVTYQKFPPVYWLDALEPLAALERLRRTPVEVAELLKDLPEEILSRQPRDGGWTIRNIVSHMRDAQGVISFRVDLFKKEEHPLLESKAVFTWATNEAERPPSTLEIFESYRASRAAMLAALESFPLVDWWRTGFHEEFGEVTLRQQVSYFASHEITHLPQIEHVKQMF